MGEVAILRSTGHGPEKIRPVWAVLLNSVEKILEYPQKGVSSSEPKVSPEV